MDLIRDLIRDLVGIIFPGSFLVILIILAILGISIIFQAEPLLDELLSLNDGFMFFIFIVFSYIAGQMLRIQTLNHLETKCTENYRRKILITYRNRCIQAFREHRFSTDNFLKGIDGKKEEGKEIFHKRIMKIDKLEKKFIDERSILNKISFLNRKYYNRLLKEYKEIGLFEKLEDFIQTDKLIVGKSDYILKGNNVKKSEFLYEFEKKYNEMKREISDYEKKYYNAKSHKSTMFKDLKEKYRKYRILLGAWEEFPYFYRNKTLNAFRKSNDYLKFYEKYEKQGITNKDNFFHFCKSVIYKYDESFKEEVLRQESLVRLLAGLYYSIKFGIFSSIVISLIHIGLLLFKNWIYAIFSIDLCLDFSELAVCSGVFSLIIFLTMKIQIIKKLRHMRNRELNLAFDGFYIICNEEDKLHL